MLYVDKLSFSYTDILFKNVSFHVSVGEVVAIIGMNGCGKTTLLSCLMGLKKPASGTIHSDFKNGFGYLKQEEDFSNGSVMDYFLAAFPSLSEVYHNMLTQPHNPEHVWKYESLGGFTWEQNLQKEISLFGFPPTIVSRVYDSLSGGEKRFTSLIRLFLEHKSCYFLDEPTNDLDLPKRMRLENIINQKKKEGCAFIMVSHDRNLLNKTVNAIVYMKGKTATFSAGNYDSLQDRLEKDLKRKEQTVEIIQRKIKQLQQDVVHKKGWAKKGYANNVKNREKHGKKGRPKDFRVGKMEKQFVTANRKKEKEIEKMKQEQPVIEECGSLKFPTYTVPNKTIVKMESVTFQYTPQKQILHDFSFSVSTKDRIALVGENGCGKSTLTSLLLKDQTPNSGTIKRNPSVSCFFIPQDIRLLYPQGSLLEFFQEVPAEKEIVRNYLASNGLKGDLVNTDVRQLSPGQLMRATFIKIVLEKVEFLFLDEPTNHLDIASIELLETSLKEFPGGFFCISHDRQFICTIADSFYEFSTTGLKSIPIR